MTADGPSSPPSDDAAFTAEHETHLPPVTGELSGINPVTVARGIAATRIALGAGLLLAPRWMIQPWLRASRPAQDALTAWRVAGARDVALGVGAMLAAKHASAGLRGWLEAGALADALDVTTLLRDRSLHPAARTAALAPAAATAALSGYLARHLGGADDG